MTHTVYMAKYRLVHFAALPSRLDVQANSRHPWNIEINGILPTFAWWGGETTANEVVWRMGGLSTPESSTAASAGSLVIKMLGT